MSEYGRVNHVKTVSSSLGPTATMRDREAGTQGSTANSGTLGPQIHFRAGSHHMASKGGVGRHVQLPAEHKRRQVTALIEEYKYG